MIRVFSFSVSPKDKAASAMVDDIKIKSIRKGTKFSYIVIEALKLYKAEVLDKEAK